jgi:3-hydroxymyristoyl/3-hydroxydecanoyl-(acyl carrier protein) dehydratase
VLEVGEKSGIFLKLVSATDPCVGADGRLAAVFVLEMLAQAAGALLNALDLAEATPGYLAGVDDFQLHREVRVGDAVHVEVELHRIMGSAARFRARAVVDGTVVAEGRVTLALPR